MKKLAILFIVLFIAGITNAQVMPGAKAGVNVSNIIKTGDSNFSTDFKVGFYGGLYLDIHLIDILTFEPGIMYSQKGYKTAGSSLLGGPYDYTLRSDFIELPLLLKIKASGFGIHVGPQISFLTNTTEKFKQGSDSYQNSVRANNDNLRNNTIGGVIGIDIGGQTVGFSAGYALDFQKNNGDGTSQTPEYKNQVFQIGLNMKL
jgi:hypothetical protein